MDPFASAIEQAEAIRRRQVTATELVQMYLDRIERLNGDLSHYVHLTPELALEMAAERYDGPLAGVPVSIKDLAALKGHPQTFGSRAFEDFVPQWDSFSVAQLKAAGMPILGKTNTSEFGTRPTTEYGLFPAARNPWNREHTTGGSSGGAGGAVAAGLCALAQGSDGGGSVRIPASCCGVVGIKPTRGRVSSGPVNGEGWAGLSTDGILARTVADAAAGLEAVTGHLPGDPFWAEDYDERPRPLRIGFTDSCAAGVDPEVARAVRDTAALLESLGHRVTESAPDLSAVREPMGVIVTSGMASLPIPDRSLLDPLNQAAALAGEQFTGGDYVRAVDTIRRASRLVVAFWDRFDVLLTPTLTKPAPRLGEMGATLETATQEYMDWLSFTQPFNCTGQPALSLPLAVSAAGLPIGIQLVGPPRGERILFALALELEQARPWADRRPDLAS